MSQHLTPEIVNDFYKVLGIRVGMSDADVRDAYKRKALEHHPDKRADGDAELFKRVAKAYELLKDGSTRKSYDVEVAEFRSKLNARKAKATSSARRNPQWPAAVTLRQPLPHMIPDGSNCTFEIAPEAFRCSLRHGDIVMTGEGTSGVIIGVGFDGIYWCESGETFATFFGCVDFGLQPYKKIGNIGTPQANKARCDSLYKKQRDDLEKFKAAQKKKTERAKSAAARKKSDEEVAKYTRLMLFLENDERKTRVEFSTKVDAYWAEVFKCLQEHIAKAQSQEYQHRRMSSDLSSYFPSMDAVDEVIGMEPSCGPVPTVYGPKSGTQRYTTTPTPTTPLSTSDVSSSEQKDVTITSLFTKQPPLHKGGGIPILKFSAALGDRSTNLFGGNDGSCGPVRSRNGGNTHHYPNTAFGPQLSTASGNGTPRTPTAVTPRRSSAGNVLRPSTPSEYDELAQKALLLRRARSQRYSATPRK